MKTTHILRISATLLLLMQLSIGAVAQYNPSNPPEPSVPVIKRQVNLSVYPSGAGSVSGGGSYEPGQTISVSASAYTNYSFVNWTRDGEEISTSSRFSYTVRSGSNNLVANYRYSPGSPAEPDTSEKRYWLNLYINPSGAGYVNSSGGTYLPGTSVTVSASAYSNYSFANWTDAEGNILSTSSSFKYVTGEKSSNLTANFRYSPGSPAEPTAPDLTSPRLYLRVNPSGAGTVTPSSGNRYTPGSSVNITASPYSGYSFANWTDKNGKIIGTSAQKSVTICDTDTTLTANFRYNPSNPNEPGYNGATRNAIYGGRTSVAPGGSFFYDVNLENKDAVYGINIDVSMPEGLTPDYSSAALTSRTAGYSYECSQVDATTWRLILRGSDPISGGSGAVIRVPVKVDPSIDYGIILNVEHSHGVIVSADGTQTAATAIGGIIKTDDALVVADSPDFVITSIEIDGGNIMPGGIFPIKWSVANKGNLPATGGWNETIYLITPSGKRLSLLTTYYDTTMMEVGKTVERQAEMRIPDFPGIEGPLDVMVELMPYVTSGEIDELQINNSTTTSGTPLTLGKRLVLTVPESIAENSAAGVRAILKRSGDRSQSEIFTISQISGDDRLVLPESVTIRKDQTEAQFVIAVRNNQRYDEDNSFTFEVTGNGYDPVTGKIEVIDDDFADFELYTSKDELTEGDSFELKIEVEKPVTEPVIFSIISDHPALFRHPSTVTLEPGKDTATVMVEVIDDDEVRLTESVEFTVSAPDYERKTLIVEVSDNDMPEMELLLTPAEVKEDSGITSVTATLRRLSNIDKKITVRLSDNSTRGDIYWPRKSIIMDKGVESVDFSLGVNDNGMVEGDRKVELTAAVFVQSCSCSPSESQGGSVTATLTIIDDDGPSLTLTSSSTSLLEGDSKGINLTISRNTDNTYPVTIHLSADNPEGLEFPESAVILSGQKSVTVNVKAPSNDISDDSRTIVFTAECDGFAKGVCPVMLTDRTLPDAIAGDFKITQSTTEVGDPIEILFTIHNSGTAPLADALKVTLYANGLTEPLGNFYTSESVQPGESLSVSHTVTLPSKTGDYELYAVINKDKTERELLYTNNISSRTRVTVLPPFRASLKADKVTYLKGESVTLSGHVEGKLNGNDMVEVYVINCGLRQTISSKVDADGNFSVTFTPYSGQSGHFAAGACFPNENLKDCMAEFDVLAMVVASGNGLTIQTTTGATGTGDLRVSNPSSIPLKNVEAKVISKPEHLNVNLKCESTIGAGETIDVNCKVKSDRPSESNDWEKIIIALESEEGVRVESPVYFYCRNPKGQLVSDISEIKTTTMFDQPRQYSFKISNKGQGQTGALTLALPDWIKPVTPKQMPSLAPNDTTDIVLRFEPMPDMQLNVPVTGRIAVNCTNGDGLAIPFSIEPVSQSTGSLVIDVCDEYTYYTEDKPHVSGAQVTIMHPVSSAVLAQGTTGEDGLYSIELPEGYYKIKVTCQRHESYQNIILVDPGTETLRTIDLGLSNFEVSFRVEETEIEDEYQIKTMYTYSTQVPTPVVTIKQDQDVNGQDMAVGESKIINFILTNEGLIKAQDVALDNIVGGEGWKMEFIGYDGPFDLGAHQSRTIPMLVTKLGSSMSVRTRENATGSGISPCMASFENWYKWRCGNELKEARYTYVVALQICAHSAALNDIMSVIAQSGNTGSGSLEPAPPVGSSDKTYRPSDNRDKVEQVETEPLICDDDAVKCADKIGKGLAGFIPGVGNMINVASSYGEAAAENRMNREQQGDKIQLRSKSGMDWQAAGSTASGMITDGIRDHVLGKLVPGDLAGPLAAGAQMGWDCKEYAYKKWKSTHGDKSRNFYRAQANEDEPQTPIELYLDQLSLADVILEEFFGDRVWFAEDAEATLEFFDAAKDFADDDNLLNNLRNIKPPFISEEKMVKFVERMTDLNPDNRIDLDKFNSDCIRVLDIEEFAKKEGYGSGAEMYRSFIREILDDLSNPEGSVCSKVKLQFTQSMVMTRQAFRGYLNVSNGDAELPLTGLTLILDIRDQNGNVATSHEFQTALENLKGFSGTATLDGPWTLDPKQEGEAQILFIPTRYAAETEPVNYTFSGLLRYRDPYTGMEVTRNLSSVTLTVSPSPVLDLEYFLPRNVYGDDPFTMDIVEESIPSEFAMTINNIGYGDAKNVRLTTNAPVIIENEKGLLVDFELIGAAVNGQDKNLALGGQVQSEFGNIPAQSSAYAQWWIGCSLAGHYEDYNVELNHVTSYGNEDLSLINTIGMHELVQGFTFISGDGTQTRAFLVNDEGDTDNLPDNVWFGNGNEAAPVDVNNTISVSTAGENSYRLKLTPKQAGWNYAKTTDPTAGRADLLSVTRLSDGYEMPVDNVWQTPYIIRDHDKPVHEKELHIIARQDIAEEYLLLFEPRPDEQLEVVEFTGVTSDALVSAPVESIGVVFNKDIDSDSFTPATLTLYCEGRKVDLSDTEISRIDDRTYEINLKNTTSGPGFYILTVFTSQLRDTDGFSGRGGYSIRWNQNIASEVNSVKSKSLGLYPVPMETEVYVCGNAGTIERIEFYDSKGRICKIVNGVSYNEAINVTDLVPDVYLVCIRTSDQQKIVKAIKR